VLRDDLKCDDLESERGHRRQPKPPRMAVPATAHRPPFTFSDEAGRLRAVADARRQN
jgi:hypothetical protein